MNRRNKKSLQQSISKKGLFKTFSILFSLFLIIYLTMLIKRIDIPVILPIEKIHVFGELEFINTDDIKAKVKASVTGGYFTVDMNLIREVLLQEPWIKAVTLRRQWPAGLEVAIEERTPIAYWNKNAYLSEAGEAFTPARIDQKLNLPVLNGPQGRHATVWQFMNVLYQEMAKLDYQVVRLDLDQRRAWQLVIEKQVIEKQVSENSGSDIEKNSAAKHVINVRLGRFNTEKRLQRFVRILPGLINEQDHATAIVEIASSDSASDEEPTRMAGKIKTIDMRYPNGFAVQRATDKRMNDVSANDMQTGGRA